VEQEDKREKAPRRSWARNHRGNPGNNEFMKRMNIQIRTLAVLSFFSAAALVGCNSPSPNYSSPSSPEFQSRMINQLNQREQEQQQFMQQEINAMKTGDPEIDKLLPNVDVHGNLTLPPKYSNPTNIDIEVLTH
jgi:hypothetical protein